MNARNFVHFGSFDFGLFRLVKMRGQRPLHACILILQQSFKDTV